METMETMDTTNHLVMNSYYKVKLQTSCRFFPKLEEELDYFLRLQKPFESHIFLSIHEVLEETINHCVYYWVLKRFSGPLFLEKLAYYKSLRLQDFKTMGLKPPYDIEVLLSKVFAYMKGKVEEDS